MAMRRGMWGGLLAGAGLALWLQMADTRALFGTDLGALGTSLLVTLAWVGLYLVSAVPQGEFERTLAPAETQAWIGAAFMLFGVAYFIAHWHVFAEAGEVGRADAHGVVRNLVMLGIGWSVLAQLMRSRWQPRVQQDERDRAIAARAGDAGRKTLIGGIVFLAVMLGFSPGWKLQWATPFLLANQLVLLLMLGWLVEYLATVAQYWRDRRLSRA